MAKLGCGDYEVFAQTRGGGQVLGLLDYQSGSFGGVLDDVSQADFTIGSRGLANEACCRVLGALDPYQHEISIHRDGDEVWVGPVLDLSFGQDDVKVSARDLFHWTERRVLPVDREITDDLANIFAQLFSDAMSQDTSPNITVAPFATGIIGTRKIIASQITRAADVLREIARTGVDFTARGRQIRCGGLSVGGISPIAILSSELLEGARISIKGSVLGTQVILTGATDPSGVLLSAVSGLGSDTRGLVQTVYSEPDILDLVSLQSSADSHYFTVADPVYVEGGEPGEPYYLSPESPIDFADLISGARVDVALDIGCRTLVAPQRLRSFTVSLSNDDATGFTELIAPVLMPLGLGTDA
jgi:hypothetical protein